MQDILSEIDFNDVSDTFETDTFETDMLETDRFETDMLETEPPAELESFLALARAAHEERIHAFWRRFGLNYDDVKS